MHTIVWFFLLLFLPNHTFARSLVIGGQRSATLKLPHDYQADKRYPLLVFLHGYTGSAEAYERYLDVSRQLDTLGVVSIVPDGTKNSRAERFWNATPECCDFENSGIDDVAYLRQLIEEAKALASIDSQRVYLMGHSNGGFMAYRMACETPGLIQGIVSIAGAGFRTPEQCLRPKALKVLQIHGDADAVVPYESNPNFPSPQATTAYWKNFMQCQTESFQSQALKLLATEGDQKDSDQYDWQNCQAGGRVGLWIIRGGSHNPNFRPEALFSKALKFLEQP